jgi:hypothetical protein
MSSADNPPPGGGDVCVAAKAKRPDVALRLKNRHTLLETVVPCALSGRLGVSFSPECRVQLYQEIGDWVVSVSKIVHRLSIIFNRLLIYLLETKTPLPKFNSSLFTSIALHGMKISSKGSKEDYSVVDDFCFNEFSVECGLYPKIQRHKGDCQAIVIACKRYETNFKNTLHVPFFTRQKSYIRTWLEHKGVSGVKTWEVQKRINRWGKWDQDKDDHFPRVLKDFILEEQKLLHIDLDGSWLKKNPDKVLSYYYRMLCFYHKSEQGKKFRLAPLCQIKCHFLTIDNIVLREILSNVRSKVDKDKFPIWVSEAVDRKDMNDDVWKSVFDYEGLRRKRRFGHQVDTNSEKVCFHFNTTKKAQHKKNRRIENKRKKNPKKRVVSIDPGRSNLITAWDEEKKEFHRLTRKQYYRGSGMKKRTEKATRRNLEMKGVYEAMSCAPTRSVEQKDWFSYQMIVARHYDKLWEFKTRRVWRKEDMVVSGLKEKCLDRFFNRFHLKGEKKPVVAYGAACFHHTGKGELSVPVKYVYKKCCSKYQTEKENEKYSTIMHYKCEKMTMRVKVGSREIRGLRWCPTCRELVSRDENASMNIKKSYDTEERPRYLCDTYEREEKRKVGAITLHRRRRKTWLYNRREEEESLQTGKLKLES